MYQQRETLRSVRRIGPFERWRKIATGTAEAVEDMLVGERSLVREVGALQGERFCRQPGGQERDGTEGE
ncbi:MAG: hypothetical protein CAPSK01_004176 [Candidatus Accumulibacter vicinus]|uniref:Uncharacterized protein n=1 Tax=Candidatus Accumulibacter vicinus TaxID=2954382 RepID=A0A084XVK3_9PROT|nr:MAG: hypothetical protein CAPSK01_004176 [Candidatus Accumulibacter vicinus]